MDGTETKLEIILIINTKVVCMGVQIESSSGTSLIHRLDSPVPYESFFVLVNYKQIVGFRLKVGKVRFFCLSLLSTSSLLLFLTTSYSFSLSYNVFVISLSLSLSLRKVNFLIHLFGFV